VRYYLYLSTAKVDMLYGQIPPKLLKCLAVEAEVDLEVPAWPYSRRVGKRARTTGWTSSSRIWSGSSTSVG
jgi:hypothetical protein